MSYSGGCGSDLKIANCGRLGAIAVMRPLLQRPRTYGGSSCRSDRQIANCGRLGTIAVMRPLLHRLRMYGGSPRRSGRLSAIRLMRGQTPCDLQTIEPMFQIATVAFTRTSA